MVEPRFGLSVLIAVAETGPSVSRWEGSWARRGCDSAARSDGRLVRSVVVSTIRQIAGGDLTPEPTGGAQGYGRA